MELDPDDYLSNSASFGRRLKRIQRIRDPSEKRRGLERLVALFRAQVITHQGVPVGYRLPNGDWFCRKMAYETRDHADIDRRRVRNEMGRNIRGVYECPQCGKWHLTHQPAHLRKKVSTNS